MDCLNDSIAGGTLVKALDDSIGSAELEPLLLQATSDTVFCLGSGLDSAILQLSTDATTGEQTTTLFDVDLDEPMALAWEAETGSRMLRLETGHDLQEGDQIMISLPADPDADDCLAAISILVTVERVGGNSIALSEKLPFDISSGSLAVQKIIDATEVSPTETDVSAYGSSTQMVLHVISDEVNIIDVDADTSRAGLQQIIDEAPAGSVVRLAEGTYGFDETLVINRSDITLEGAGAGETVIVNALSNSGNAAIQIGLPIYQEELGAELSLAWDALEGGNSLRLESGHGLEVGDRIYIYAENTDALFEEIGDTEWQKDSPLRTFITEVVAVGGDSIALADALPFNFPAAETTVSTIELLDDVTISGLTVTTTYGESDPSDFSNTLSEEYRASAITVNGTDGVSLQDIEVSEPGSNGILFAKSIYADVDDIWVHGAHNKGDGGNGYAISVRDVYNSTFTDLTLEDARHSFLFASYTSATDNYVHVSYTNRDINFHGGLDTGNVVEVDESIRTSAEQYYLGGTLFFNEGKSYGAPTDAQANEVTFKTVIGTNKADLIYSHESGSEVWGYMGGDTIHTGAGDDIVYGETGHDIVYASTGTDLLDAGSGVDTLVFTQAIGDVEVNMVGDDYLFTVSGGITWARDFETFEFADGSYSENELQDCVIQVFSETNAWLDSFVA